jgi:hypothetical protein
MPRIPNPYTKREMLILAATLAALACVALSGCGTRENAKSLKHAEHAVQGAAKRLASPDLSALLAELPEETRAKVEAWMRPTVDLLAQAIRSMAAPQRVLETPAVYGPPAPAEVTTSAEQAAEEPAAFIATASAQAGRAELEADQVAAASNVRGLVVSYAGQVAGNSLSALLAGGGGGLGLLAMAMKGVGVYRDLKREIDLQRGETARQAAVAEEAVAFGSSAAAIAAKADPEALEQVKKEADRRQERRGVRADIRHLAKGEAPPPRQARA